MPTGYISNWAANTALQVLLQAPVWLAMHSDDPTALGSAASEYLGGGYVRQPISFAAPAARASVSVNAQVFTALMAGSVLAFAVWNQVSAGNMIFAVVLDAPLPVLDTGQVRVAPGDIALAF